MRMDRVKKALQSIITLPVNLDEAAKSSKSRSGSIRPRGGEKADLDC